MEADNRTTCAPRNKKVPVVGMVKAVPKTNNKTSTTPNSDVCNFDLGESNLFEDSFFDCNTTQVTSTSSGGDADSEGDYSPAKIVSIRSSRRSLSYDIVFNSSSGKKNNNEIAIRIHEKGASSTTSRRRLPNNRRLDDSAASSGSTNSRAASSSSASSVGSEDYVNHLEKIVASLRIKNKGLEEEVRILKGKLGDANKTIRQLEVEVTNFYSS
jgi:hypothetical protein